MAIVTSNGNIPSIASALVSSVGPYSIGARVYCTSLAAAGNGFVMFVDSGHYDGIGISTGGVLDAFTEGGQGNGGTITTNRYYDLWLVRRSATLLETYLDHVLVNTQTSNIAGRGAFSRITLGQWGSPTDGWYDPFIGNWSNCFVYNRALSINEMRQQSNSGRIVVTGGLQAYWPMLPGSPNRVQDFSGNGRSLTIVGTVTDAVPAPVNWNALSLIGLAQDAGSSVQTLTLSAITPRQIIGTQVVPQNVLPSAIAPRQLIGLSKVNYSLNLTGISPRQQVGLDTLNPTIAPSSIPPRQQVGLDTLVPAAVTVTVDAIPPKQVVGSDTLNLSINPSSIPPHQQIGLDQLNSNLALVGITPRQIIGLAQLNLNAVLSAIAPRQQIGLPSLANAINIILTAIAPRQVLGTIQLNENLALVALTPRQRLGTQQLNLNVLPNGLTSKQVLGALSLVAGGVTISLTSIQPRQQIGLDTLVPAAVTITLTGILPRQQIGIEQLNINIAVLALTSRQRVGAQQLNTTILLAGLSPRLQVGMVALTQNGNVISLNGLAPRQVIGGPSLITLAGFVMARNRYAAAGKRAYRPAGKVPYKA